MILPTEQPPGHARPTHFPKSLANYYGNHKTPQIEYTTLEKAIEQAGIQ